MHRHWLADEVEGRCSVAQLHQPAEHMNTRVTMFQNQNHWAQWPHK